MYHQLDLFVAGQTDIKQQGNTAVLLEPQPLRDGVEFANVQRVFEESKTFQFSAPNRITSPRDVAYIFKQLETSSVENAFAVLVKDHKPTVIHLAIGTFSRVMVTMEPIMAADKRIHADEIYFIHNHPSGKVVASNADMVTYTTMRQIFGERLQPGIIINTRSGNYGMFTSDNPAIGPEAIATDENQTYAIPTYSFSKLVFSQNYREAGFVRNSMDVASFVSGQRLGDRQKLSYIILSNSNEIQANVHTHYSKLTAPDYMPLAKRMADDIITYGGASIITYGSCTLNASEVRRLQKNLRETAPSESGNVLLDHINIKSNINVGLTSSFAAAAEKTYSYESASDEGWLREPCERYAISSPAEHEEIQGIALTRKENIKNRIEAFHQAQSTLDEIKNLIHQMDIRTRFIGEQGAANLDKAEEATTRLDNLAVARDMEAAGKDAYAVKMATGWERGADGKWRYEEDDNLDGIQLKTQEDLLKEYRQAKRESDVASWKWQSFSDKNPALRYRTSKKNSQEENDRLVQQREKAKKRERELFAENMRLRDIAWESQKRLEDGLNGVSLRELLGENHPLLTAYPEMDEIEVSFYSSGRYINSSNYGGYYAPETRSIFINTDTTADRMRSTLAHELQHAIQHIEGFARGGNYKAGYELAKRMDKLTDDQREFMDSIRIYNDWKAKGNLREDYRVSEYIRGLHDVFSEDFFRDISIMTDEEIQHEYNRLSEKSSYERMTAYEAYKNISGEVEARNVQCRMNMTAEERRASLASETEDVAREDQIFLNEVLGTAAFVKADDIKKAPMESSTGASSNETELRTNHQGSAVSFDDTAKIRKNLDNLVSRYSEISRPNTFIGDLSNALGLKNNGNNSRYGTFKAKNGVEFRLRISDHNAASKNFDDAGYKDGLSIVVSRKPNNGITNNGEAHITEYYYNAYKLAKAEGRPLADIARSLQQALYSGEYKDMTGLAERHEVNAEELADRLSSPIRIVKANEIRHSDPDLEKRLRDTKGWYDASTGEVFVVFDNIMSVNDFKQTVLHEVVGHKGLRAVVGQKAFGTLCESVYRSMPATEQRTYLKRYGSRSIAGEEYMATLAEQDAHQNTPVWNKVTTAVKVALNSIGIQVDYSIGEMRELLRRSTRQLERTLDSTIKKVPVRVNGVKLDKGTRRQLALGHSVVLDLPDKKTGKDKPVRLSWSEKQGLTGRPSLGGQKHKI